MGQTKKMKMEKKKMMMTMMRRMTMTMMRMRMRIMKLFLILRTGKFEFGVLGMSMWIQEMVMEEVETAWIVHCEKLVGVS